MARGVGVNRHLNVLVGAVGLSALGDWLALVPLALFLQETTGSGITLALLYLAFWAPSVVLAGLAGPAIWLVPALAFMFFFVGGVAHGTKNVLIRTLMHERVPTSLHGRAFAAYNGLRNGAELVALVAGGVLVSTVGARWTMLVAGVIPVLAGLIALAITRRRLAEPVVTEPAP